MIVDIYDHLVRCDISGFTFKRSECRMRWDGRLVGKDFWEPRQPQDLIRVRKDDQSILNPRPDQASPPLADPPITVSQMI
jgi:hypothetical protein